MNELVPKYEVGFIGDSHLMRMSSFMNSGVRIIGRGGERVANFERYLSEMSDLDFLIVFLGGNDITGRNGQPGASRLCDLVYDIRMLADWARQRNVKVLTCDLIPRTWNAVGTDLSNKRLLKRFKKRHIRLNGFQFNFLSDGVHLQNYELLWEFLETKLVARVWDAYKV